MKSIVINIASACGYTESNMTEIAEFAKMMKDKVSIYLYPSDDFNQEPLTDEQIQEFCTKYGLTELYPTVKIMAKTSVLDPNNEVYQFLQKNNHLATEQGVNCDVDWNFQKYYINTNGTLWGFSYAQESILDEGVVEWAGQLSEIETS
jgi:glutathione peroxidase